MAENRRALYDDQDDDIYEQFYDLKSVASTTELTGLTPSLPVSRNEIGAYEQIYGVPVPEGIENNSKRERKKQI